MFVTNWISTTKIQKISEITNFFRHYFLSRTEVVIFTFVVLIYRAGISLCLGGLHFQNKQYNESQTIKLQDNEQNYRHRDSSLEGRVT